MNQRIIPIDDMNIGVVLKQEYGLRRKRMEWASADNKKVIYCQNGKVQTLELPTEERIQEGLYEKDKQEPTQYLSPEETNSLIDPRPRRSSDDVYVPQTNKVGFGVKFSAHHMTLVTDITGKLIKAFAGNFGPGYKSTPYGGHNKEHAISR